MNNILEVNVDDLYLGGVFSLLKEIILYINKHAKGSIHIDIACIEEFTDLKNKQMFESLGTNVYYIGYKKSKVVKQFFYFKNLRSLIRNQGYRFVHIHGDVAYKLFVLGLASKLAGCPNIIFHSHASGVDGNHRIIKTIAHKSVRRLLRFVGTEFVSCSNYASKWMYPNIKEEKIINIKNGIDLNKFRFNDSVREKVRMELNLKNEIIIGHVGRFAYQKNHDYLIEVFKEFHQRNTNAKLLLVGDGALKETIIKRVEQENLSSNVIFYGTSVSVNELLQAMDIFVLPSYFEGLPIAGVEAQASGLPVIFSNMITREAQISNNVVFLPIKSENINEWCNMIENFSTMNINREKCYEMLKENNFDLTDTVKNFLSLYNINLKC